MIAPNIDGVRERYKGANADQRAAVNRAEAMTWMYRSKSNILQAILKE